MHLRRAILLFALVLGLTALAAGVSPSRDAQTTAVPTGPSPAPPGAGARPREVTFDASRAAGRPAVRRASVGDHLLVAVSSREGGLVTIPRLGRTATVTPITPARFDLLAPAAGRYDVLLAASGADEARRVGTLVTRPWAGPLGAVHGRARASAAMTLDLSLAPDTDRGGHRYRAVLSGEIDAAAVRELSAWLADAKQNPDARFLIDLSGAERIGRRARLELRALLRRHDDLRRLRRLSVVSAPRARRAGGAAARAGGASAVLRLG